MSDIDSNMLERLHQQSEEIMRLRAEIERLRELYSDWRETQECLERASDDAIERKAEIERLTAALQWIADRGDVDDLDSLDEIIERARAALEGKP